MAIVAMRANHIINKSQQLEFTAQIAAVVNLKHIFPNKASYASHYNAKPQKSRYGYDDFSLTWSFCRQHDFISLIK